MSRYNYFQEMAVDGYAFGDNSPLSFGFIAQGIALLNRGAFTVEYSFDGRLTHGDLNPEDESRGIVFDARNESKIWFRSVDGFSTVRVEAWGGWGRAT